MITVIVAVYNVERYIRNCLESILKQSFRDFELLLVDDGSTDAGIDTALEVLEKCDISWRILEKQNGGQSSARNFGLRQAKGDYVVFIDSDDVIHEDFLKRLMEHMNEDIDFTFCGFSYVKSPVAPVDDDPNFVLYDKDALIDAFLKRTISFVVPSMLFRKEFLLENELLFREDIRFSEDQLFIWEVLFKSHQAVYLPAKLYGYYLRESSIMTGSAYERIVTGHEVFKAFCEELENKYPEYEKKIALILPRWQLGTLYTAASLLDYKDYKQIYQMMEGRSLFKRVAGIGEKKAYALAAVSSFSVAALYKLCKRMDLNG
ncbi:MAG: glycosyltransferase family 2 protein [Erysipelotrichaceae bacterium]|nr:glycosyltransferase family 2 protein [Erysipelotrichaceae bacterium]